MKMKQPDNRRKEILEILKQSKKPISGTKLAKEFDVSRQVIVQDIAILKAENHEIISTNRGYNLEKNLEEEMVIKVSHSDDKIEEELNIIVDAGATVKDVFVSHKAYGIIRADLNIRSRRDIKKLLDDIAAGISRPLKGLTGGYHYHTIQAENKEILFEIQEELKEKGFIVEK